MGFAGWGNNEWEHNIENTIVINKTQIKSPDEIIKAFLQSKEDFYKERWEEICENSDAKLLLEIPRLKKYFKITNIEYIPSCMRWESGHLLVHASWFHYFDKWHKDIYSSLVGKFSVEPIFREHNGYKPPYDGACVYFNDKKICVRIT